MSADLPPTIDPRAAARWSRHLHPASPWLHEEIGRRMQERLQWIRLQPRSWVDWEPMAGGMQVHAAVAQAYPQAVCWVVEPDGARQQAVTQALHTPWWNAARWRRPPPRFGIPPDGTADMVWANMSLHMQADPAGLLRRWGQLLATNGFLMFSCLGPDTLIELRALYQSMGWPAPAHEFTDMHDWGDMLVQAGFAEPVMDMERLTLTFTSPDKLFAELRGLGRNLYGQRFAGLRARGWQAQLQRELVAAQTAQRPGEPLTLTFEVIYGHALKPPPRVLVQPETVLSLQEMRQVLQLGRRDAAPKS
ncbi:MAG: methyltransferase domain-containing protein [Burkholderiaceae bacterium]